MPRGEVHAVVGENGSGRSTLLGIASGFVDPDQGTVRIGGEPLRRDSPAQARKLGLAMAYQDTSLILPEPVKNNLFLAAPEDRRPPFWRRKRWARRCSPSSISTSSCSRTPRRASSPWPDRQLFEVAKALVVDPKVLLLDEPTTALGPDEVDALHRTVVACSGLGVGVVYVSHRLPEVLEIADRITVLRDGRNRGTFDAKATTEAELVELIVGRPFEAAFPPPAPEVDQRRGVLVVDGLQGQSFGPVSFTLDAGEIVGIAGAEGNGQPQLFDCLAGRQPPKAGRVVCDGKELSLISTHEAVGAGVMLLPGDRKHEALMPVLGVKVNTTIQSLRRFSVLGLLKRRNERRAVTDLVQQLEIRTPSIEQPVEFLSGGNQQKVSVARSFFKEPSVILAYEPTQGVDVGSRFDIYQALRSAPTRGPRCSSSRATPSSSPGCAIGCSSCPGGRSSRRSPATSSTSCASSRRWCGGPVCPGRGDRPSGSRCRGAPRRTGNMSGRIDEARRAVRKVIRDARDKNKWRKIVRFRLWMPVALQVLLVAALLFYTTSRFPGFVNAYNVEQILILALPLIVAAMAQTHALLVGYLDLSVGGMIGLGVVIASFLIGAEASAPQILFGIGVILVCGVVLGLVNAGLIRGLKIPSIIATLATLSILDGISLTMRPTAQGVINPGLVSALTASIGPIPVAFIVIVVGAGLADLWLHASGSGLELRAVGFDERSAKRGGVRTNWLRVRALVLSAVLAAVAAFFVMARSPIGNATIGSTFALNSITAAVLGGASSPAAGPRSWGARWRRCFSRSSSPSCPSSVCHPTTGR